MPVNIKDISFENALNTFNIETYIVALKTYQEGYSNAISLDNNLPIFLDTNVLTRYYKISIKSRLDLLSFFDQYKERFFLTNQVQKEFLNNRESIIDEFFDGTLAKLKSSFQSDIINKIQSYINVNKKYMDDFSFLDGSLNNVMEELQKTYKELIEQIESKIPNLQNIKYEDDLLNVVKAMKFINNISEEEKKYLIDEFKSLSKDLTRENITNEIKKTRRAFPGAGDIKEKPDDPYGDYIIYHEIIKYMKESDTDAIILTYDVRKGDWFTFNNEPHIHYIQINYHNTGKTLFFVNANKFFEEKFQKHFDSLIQTPKSKKSVNSETNANFIMKYIELESLIRNIAKMLHSIDIIDMPNSDRESLIKIVNTFAFKKEINSRIFNDFKLLTNHKNLLLHDPDNMALHQMSADDYYKLHTKLESMIAGMEILKNKILEAFN